MRLIDSIRCHMSDRSRQVPVGVIGENLTRGPRLGGIGAQDPDGSFVFFSDVPNCELAHAGFGFGAAMAGINVYWIVKQLDFLFLSSDQLHNTYRLLAQNRERISGSLTVLSYVMDEDYQGSQSSATDIFSITPRFFDKVALVSTCVEFDHFIKATNGDPLRIIFISQRHCRKNLDVAHCDFSIGGLTCYKYSERSSIGVMTLGTSIFSLMGKNNFVDNKYRFIVNVYALRMIKLSELLKLCNGLGELHIFDDYDIVGDLFEHLYFLKENLKDLRIKIYRSNVGFNGFRPREDVAID